MRMLDTILMGHYLAPPEDPGAVQGAPHQGYRPKDIEGYIDQANPEGQNAFPSQGGRGVYGFYGDWSGQDGDTSKDGCYQ